MSGYTELRRLVFERGVHHESTFLHAFQVWNSLDFSQGSFSTVADSAKEDFAWRTSLQVSPDVVGWIMHILAEMGKTFGTSTLADDLVLGALDCPYGFLVAQYVLLVGFQLRGDTNMRQEMAKNLLGAMEVLLDAPYNTFDFLESTWRVSSSDMAVNLDSDTYWESFDSYAAAVPLPPAVRYPWHHQGNHVAPRRLASIDMVRDTTKALRVGVVQLHDGTAAELMANIEAAVALLVGTAHSVDDMLDIKLYFTQLKALRGTEVGERLSSSTVAPFAMLKEMLTEARSGGRTFSSVAAEWLPSNTPDLVQYGDRGGRAALDILVCSEPFWLCVLLAKCWPTFLGVLHMALLNEFPFRDEHSLQQFWQAFFDMAARKDVFLSAAAQLTVEQVAYQTGLRLCYVPFLGLHVDARYAPEFSQRRALLFRNNRQHAIAFQSALQLMMMTVPDAVPVDDMNRMREALSFQRLAKFHAVVVLPHGPNALRLSDLYALGMPMLIPDEPLVHKFVWASRTFACLDADPVYQSVAPKEIMDRHGSSVVERWTHPFSPFNFVRSWTLHRFIDDRRYWYQYTEWATLPHLLRFKSIPDLLEKLAAMDTEALLRVSVNMGRHHRLQVAGALAWWQSALAEVSSHERQKTPEPQ
eukprot:TRINITY_DN33983_c0_g1_i4.p1 TRINITY_DN33983_c0_g1~~TRINITY_DN33983_c0_g1_i4.p1  ORF type:complete len:706 (+),score=104.63 TRINITY_DN33983_c0_g1_i4:201-2120(+)